MTIKHQSLKSKLFLLSNAAKLLISVEYTLDK
jgi:hypothetical protein